MATSIGFSPTAIREAQGTRTDPSFKLFGDDGLTFSDVLDFLNPLHHIPVVGNIYRKVSGDQIDPAIQIAGGAALGGPLGAGFAALSAVISQLRQAPEPIQPDSTDPQLVTLTSQPWNRDLPGPTVRRGGWMVAASYAGFDSRTRSTIDARV
ncbi:MAG: hypothetical protein AAF384_14350 [Pseudomonadota bacterium]